MHVSNSPESEWFPCWLRQFYIAKWSPHRPAKVQEVKEEGYAEITYPVFGWYSLQEGVSLDSPPPMVEYSFVPWNLPIGAWLTWYPLSEISKVELAGGPSNSHLDEIDRVLCPDRVHADDI